MLIDLESTPDPDRLFSFHFLRVSPAIIRPSWGRMPRYQCLAQHFTMSYSRWTSASAMGLIRSGLILFMT